MKAVLYEIEISESTLHFTHGMNYSIFEIYIPKVKIFINHKGIWKYHLGRYKRAKKIKQIEVPDHTAKALANYLNFKKDVEKISSDILKNYSKGLKTTSEVEKKGTKFMSLSQTKKVPAKFLFRDKMNLKYYQKKILRLAKKKGFDQELFYLFGRMVQEGGEMLDAIWQGKSDEDVGEEFADIEHFVLQMLAHRPKIDPDKALNNKIESNYKNKKKTNVNGKMVRK